MICLVPLSIIAMGIEAYFALQGAEGGFSFWPRLFYAPLSLVVMIVTVIIASKVSENNVFLRFLTFVGSISLELYLIHLSAVGFIQKMELGIDINKGISSILINIILIVIAFGLSILIHKATDKIRNSIRRVA